MATVGGFRVRSPGAGASVERALYWTLDRILISLLWPLAPRRVWERFRRTAGAPQGIGNWL